MIKQSKSMTTILIIITAIILVYVGAWIRVGFMIDINLGCKTTYFPKYGLPFVWIVTITPDPKLPKLSSGCKASRYEVNVFSKNIKRTSETNTMPDLSAVDNQEAKKLIEKYYTEIKPVRDEIEKQIPKEGVVISGDSINIPANLFKRWKEINDSVGPLLKRLSELSKEHDIILIDLSVTSAKAEVYVNDILVSTLTSENSDVSGVQIYNNTDYRKYIKLGTLFDRGFVLKKGVNQVRIVYDIPKKTTSVPVTATFNLVEVSPEGAMHTGDELLKLEENSSSIIDGVDGKKSGELKGTFVLK